LTWYSFQIDKTTFGIFDSFEEGPGRGGAFKWLGSLKALMGKADELLSSSDIKKIDILSISRIDK
jgi:hypothetical protein